MKIYSILQSNHVMKAGNKFTNYSQLSMNKAEEYQSKTPQITIAVPQTTNELQPTVIGYVFSKGILCFSSSLMYVFIN